MSSRNKTTEMKRMNLMQGDCLERMKEIPDGSVDAIICDPPYGTMKGINQDSYKSPSDFKWDTAIAHKAMLEQCNRILRPNGALCLFSQDPYTAKLMTERHGNLPFSYRYTWKKDSFGNVLMCNKAPVSYTEDVCVFFKKYDTLNQHPLRVYSVAIFAWIGKTKKQIFADMGTQAVCHFMRTESMQFGICTEATYSTLVSLYGLDQMDGFMQYAELVEIDTAHKETISRTFNLPDGKKYKSNVLEYRKDYRGEHPTQKPVALMEDLVKTYTNEGETVLDFTMGSGTTGVACKNLNRDFIGIEKDLDYFNIALERIESCK